MPETIVTVGGQYLTNIKSYDVNDFGKQINRVDAAGDSTVYYQEAPYRIGFTDIKISGEDFQTTIDALDVLYEAGNEVTFTDAHGHSYSNVMIVKFTWNFSGDPGGTAASYNLELVIVHDTEKVLIVGSSTTKYIIEQCSLTEKVAEPEVVVLPAGAKIMPKYYTNKIFDLRISGIELVNTSSKEGEYTTTLAAASVIDVTTPEGRALKAILVRRETASIPGIAGMQTFNADFIATDSAGNILTSAQSIIESWSVANLSGRISIHDVIAAVVVQNFDKVAKRGVVVNLLTVISTVGVPTYYNPGNTFSSTLGRLYYTGYITSVNENSVEGNELVKRITIGFTDITSGSWLS